MRAFRLLPSLAFVLAAASAQATPSVVIDIATGEILQQEQATAPWFPASVSKLMTVYVALKAVREGRISLDTPLVVSEEIFDEMLTTNVQSGFFLGREIAARMKQEKLPGRLLYVTSLHAYSPRNLAHDSAGKAGMTMVMRELARDLGPAGIRVNAIAPGAVPGGGANFSEAKYASMIPMRRTGRPQDVADTAIALLCDRFSGYVTGTTVTVDGGMSLYNWVPFAGP